MSKLWLTYDWNEEKQAYLCVITDAHPRKHRGKVMVLDVELVPTPAAAHAWFKRMRVERPWEPRN